LFVAGIQPFGAISILFVAMALLVLRESPAGAPIAAKAGA
jgi:hypothetical protein